MQSCVAQAELYGQLLHQNGQGSSQKPLPEDSTPSDIEVIQQIHPFAEILEKLPNVPQPTLSQQPDDTRPSDIQGVLSQVQAVQESFANSQLFHKAPLGSVTAVIEGSKQNGTKDLETYFPHAEVAQNHYYQLQGFNRDNQHADLEPVFPDQVETAEEKPPQTDSSLDVKKITPEGDSKSTSTVIETETPTSPNSLMTNAGPLEVQEKSPEFRPLIQELPFPPAAEVEQENDAIDAHTLTPMGQTDLENEDATQRSYPGKHQPKVDQVASAESFDDLAGESAPLSSPPSLSQTEDNANPTEEADSTQSTTPSDPSDGGWTPKNPNLSEILLVESNIDDQEDEKEFLHKDPRAQLIKRLFPHAQILPNKPRRRFKTTPSVD